MSPPTEREKMVSGQPYDPLDPELVAARAQARRLAHAFDASDPGDEAGRRVMLAKMFGHVGFGAWVEAPVHFDYGWNISLGDRAFVNFGCVLLDCAPITIGAGTLLAPGVQLCAATHPVDPEERRRGTEYALPIAVGDNVWIGAGAIVAAGVTIGDDSVVGAASVVLRDVPARVLVGGNPARVLRRLV
jgi:maltose O-acetyltransferase